MGWTEPEEIKETKRPKGADVDLSNRGEGSPIAVGSRKLAETKANAPG
ncbi:hypothetical protein [Oceanobacillus massiliensis]|nr:hypothetical protein [Oceanobacillus massiliensis]